MKITNYILAAALALLGLSCAQGNNTGRDASSARSNSVETLWDRINNTKNPDDSGSLRRLESITWDSVKHQLSWDVSKGDRKGTAYQPRSKDRYEINMDNATMTVNGQSRKFSEDEAANVRKLMDFISRYALESTVWWENGEGDPVDGNSSPGTVPRQLPRVPPNDDNHNNSGSKAIRIVAVQR